ncbi:MAG TPA: branched-chain amino acid ABC transporter permease [Nonomuraea sp.]|nr:branched-chain amino acid ABC transporter permease [Nonomuraea sp.]
MAIDIVVPVVSGAVQGCVYGLLGLGLVLLYKSGRIFNFAQAEMGAFAAFMTAFADAGSGFLPDMPVWAAVLFGMITGVLLGLLVERLVIRPLFDAPKVTVVVATAGVFLFLYAIEGFLSGPGPRSATRIIDGDLFTRGGLRITNLGGVIVLVLAVLAVTSALFFSRTRMGTAIIAVSQEPTATRLVGISVERTAAFTWAVAGLLGAIAGILLSGTNGVIAPGLLTGLALVPAFTAAVFGGITALPGAFVGGVVIGIIEAFAASNIPKDILPGSGKVVLFAALLAVLLFRPAGLLGKET